MRAAAALGARRLAQDRRRDRRRRDRARARRGRARPGRLVGRSRRRDGEEGVELVRRSSARHRAARPADARPRRIHRRGAAARRSRARRRPDHRDDGQGPLDARTGHGSGATSSHLVPKGSLPHAELAQLVDRASRGTDLSPAGDAMSKDAQILIVEDNPRNMKLARDVLDHHGYRTLEAADAEEGLALARTEHPALILMDVQLPGMDGVEALERLRARPGDRRHPRGRADRVRDAAPTASGSSPRASTAISRSRSTCRSFPRQIAALLDGAGDGGAAMSDQGTLLVVDDLPQNVRLLEAVFEPRGYDGAIGGLRAARRCRLLAGTPVDLVLLDIVMPGDGRLCRLPRAARGPGDGVPAGRDDHRERRPGAGSRAIEAGADDFVAKPFEQAELLARVRSLLRIKQYHDTIDAPGEPSSPSGTRSSSGVSRRRSSSSSGWGGCGGSSRRSWPIWSSRPATTRSSRATAARSPSCSATCAASRRSPRRSSPRTSWRCCASTTRRSATSSTASRGRSSGSPATGSWSSSTIRSRATTRRSARCAWRSRCARGWRSSQEDWRRRGHDLGFGVGIAQGHATLGRIGFEGRSDYAAIGSVTNVAARLCDEAEPGQILISQRVYAAAEDMISADSLGDLNLRGFSRPMRDVQRGGTRRGAGDGMTELADQRAAAQRARASANGARGSRACRSASGRSGRRCGATTPASRSSCSRR